MSLLLKNKFQDFGISRQPPFDSNTFHFYRFFHRENISVNNLYVNVIYTSEYSSHWSVFHVIISVRNNIEIFQVIVPLNFFLKVLL